MRSSDKEAEEEEQLSRVIVSAFVNNEMMLVADIDHLSRRVRFVVKWWQRGPNPENYRFRE